MINLKRGLLLLLLLAAMTAQSQNPVLTQSTVQFAAASLASDHQVESAAIATRAPAMYTPTKQQLSWQTSTSYEDKLGGTCLLGVAVGVVGIVYGGVLSFNNNDSIRSHGAVVMAGSAFIGGISLLGLYLLNKHGKHYYGAVDRNKNDLYYCNKRPYPRFSLVGFSDRVGVAYHF